MDFYISMVGHCWWIFAWGFSRKHIEIGICRCGVHFEVPIQHWDTEEPGNPGFVYITAMQRPHRRWALPGIEVPKDPWGGFRESGNPSGNMPRITPLTFSHFPSIPPCLPPFTHPTSSSPYFFHPFSLLPQKLRFLPPFYSTNLTWFERPNFYVARKRKYTFSLLFTRRSRAFPSFLFPSSIPLLSPPSEYRSYSLCVCHDLNKDPPPKKSLRWAFVRLHVNIWHSCSRLFRNIW